MTDTDVEIRLDRLRRQQRVLAWRLSILTFGMTIGFFALMGFDAAALSRIALGRSVTVANMLAAAIILVFLLSIGLFGRRASRIDELMNIQKRSR
jgi:uncharacterized membrane protein (DUF485 family)